MLVPRGSAPRLLVTRGYASGSPGSRFPAAARGCALTIGNFDGVHLAHQAMLARVVETARRGGLRASVLTFEPHPRELFTPESAPTRLTNLREKLELVGAHGVDHVHVQRFSRAFAAIEPETFVERVLARSLGVRWLLVGDDFRFGAKRAGDFALLSALARRHGFDLEAMPTVMQGDERVSSSAVREALAAGDMPRAHRLLGRPYSISGHVVHGDKLGRTLGYATANVHLKHNRPPLTGVFAVRARGENGFARLGVASLGVRPTVTRAGPLKLEVHLFDFSGELYGHHLRVEFLAKIRDEAKYDDLETLRAQIARDCDAARDVLRHYDLA